MALLTKFPNNKLIVDLSYYIYYRITACMAVYHKIFDKHELPYNKEKAIEYDWTLDDEYMAIYEKSFSKNIKEFCKKKRISLEHVVLAKDCKRSNIWRRDLFPEYKANRDKPAEPTDLNFGPLFYYTNTILVPQLIDTFGMKKVKVVGAEGDDVVAVLAEHFNNDGNIDTVYVMANDRDISQIVKDGIEMYDTKGQNIGEKVVQKYGSPTEMLKMKILTGDKGDNIPSICPRMGDGTAKKCINNIELLKEKFIKYPSSPAQYQLNKRLIDFDHIPKSLKSMIINEYKDQCGDDIFEL